MPKITLYRGEDRGNFVYGIFKRLMREVEGSHLDDKKGGEYNFSLTYRIEPEVTIITYNLHDNTNEPVASVMVTAAGTR